jgi:hypothetical protein
MRTSFVRRGVSAALASLAAATTIVIAASPARADVAIAAITFSTTTVVLDGDAGCGNRTNVTIKIYDPQPSDDELWNVSADVVQPGGDLVDFLAMNYSSRSGDYVYYTDSVFLCGFNKPGSYQVQAKASWWDDSVSDDRLAERTTKFSVVRPTSLTYDATPEPVKKGAKLTQTGQLKFDPVGYGAKYGVKGMTVKFYFKATGSSTWVYKGSAVTGTNGKYSKKITATKTGLWKAVYTGGSTHQSQTKYDTVKVK